MNHPILKIDNISHKYGNYWAIRDISFEIKQTGILGLLGSNGAGKSTTMNIMCGVLNQTQGKVMIDGIDLRTDPEQAKKNLGFLPQVAPLYTDLTIDEYLRHCAALRLMDDREIAASVERVKEKCGIAHFSKRLIGNLSGGYKQRVGIAQAIIHQPKIVVLDEPTNGLDPNQIIEVRSLIKEIAEERAVVFSSHILSEVQILCDRVVMIEEGRIVFADSMHAFNNYVEPHSLLLNMEKMPAPEDLLTIKGVTEVEVLTNRLVRIYFTGDQEIMEIIIETCVQQRWRLREITMEKGSLDEVFAQLSKHQH